MLLWPLTQDLKQWSQVYKNTIDICQYVNNVQMRHYSVDISVNLRQ